MTNEQLLAILNDTRIELAALKKDNERLKSLINKMVASDNLWPEDIKAYEIKNMLHGWANSE